MRCISAIYVKECLKFSLKSRNIQEGLQIKDEPPPPPHMLNGMVKNIYPKRRR